jgi:RND family efflux transporter MFP subunit
MLVEAWTAETGSASVVRRFAGYTHPWEAHGIGFMVAGRVTSMKVKEGDIVTKGQLLATLAPEDYALIKRLAEVQVDAIKPNFDRVDELVKDQALPAASMDEVRGRYQAALTQKAQASRQLEYTRLTAPCDGVVMERRTSVGQVIGAGMPAVVVLDLSRIKVKVAVTQQDLYLFKAGDNVEVTIPGFELPLTGPVHNIALVPDPRTRTFEVEVVLDNADGALRPGLLAHLTLVARRSEGFIVPLNAVRRDREKQPVVYLLDESGTRVVERRVELGPLFGSDIEIASGLDVGDRLIVSGQGFVSPGDEVRVK